MCHFGLFPVEDLSIEVLLDLALGDVGVKLSIPNALGYEALLESIASLRSQIMKQQKREIAFELLPKVLK